MPRRMIALMAVAVLAAAACGDSGDDRESPPRDQDQGGGIEGTGEGSSSIKALDFSFDPGEISVEPGEEVSIEIVNAGSAAHTFTADAVDVDVTADVGGSALVGFTAPGEDTTIEFHCRFHSQMTGVITVGSGGTGAGSGGGSGDAEADYDY